MQSAFERAKKIIDKNQDMFIVLEELDRTGKFRKRTCKKRVNFTIDEDVFNEFRACCIKKGIKMSSKIENLIKKELMNNKKEKLLSVTKILKR